MHKHDWKEKDVLVEGIKCSYMAQKSAAQSKIVDTSVSAVSTNEACETCRMAERTKTVFFVKN